ncbi:purine/pyrimidine permease [Sporomusa sp.]|uniref:uracil-xanthine permease family protein n=1 Tax=Sporomusa sp. TaxID=2078658 RepID=UPI002B6FE884|nr:purine/pyrimidine permease [Sporomusa sp.]HWR45520.1 purine/pyrimidine permease [Sporomusa sp.]
MSQESKLPQQLGMRYGLNDNLPLKELISYSVQHLTYFLANAAILPAIVGGYLGLDQLGLASLVQRTFILCGIVSIFQSLWGHRFPIMEGPAGLWYGVLITLATSAPSLGKGLDVLRTDIEMGFIIAGIVCIFIGLTGMAGMVVKVFSPMVNGVFLVLMCLQLSPAMIKGMLGLNSTNHMVDFNSLLAFVITTGLIMWITLKGKGFFQSIAVLVGVGFGWITALILGISPQINQYSTQLPTTPEVFAWGTPTFDIGVVLACVFAALLLFSNLIASILGMSAVTGEPVKPAMFNRGAIFTGVSDIFAGLGAVIGFIPYASAIGFTSMTGVASRKPFIVGASLITILGIFPQVGIFFAAIPPAVGNSVMFVVFCLILGMGIKEFSKVNLTNREMYILGIALMVGVGVMFLPQEVFNNLPPLFRYMLLNGMVDGIIICIVLEQILLNDKLMD